MSRPSVMALCLLSALLAAACQRPVPDPGVVLGPVEPAVAFDEEGFAAFLATRPTPQAFRAEWPGILLVLPGEAATRELRLDRSRFFAETDAQGRITGGVFQ